MAMNVDVLAMMEEEDRKAAERPVGNFVPTFLRLKDKQKARVRPLFNLDGMVVLAMHNEYNKANPKDSINAVCSTENGQECPYCEAAKDNKKLAATTTFFLPVYVSQVEVKGANNIWTRLTYKDKEDVEHEVSGLRIVELKRYGSINQILQFIRSLYTEDDQHDIRQYGLIIERSDANPKNPTYTILQKGPGAMPEVASKLIPTQEAVRSMILAACPPAGTAIVSAVSSVPASNNGKVKAEDDDF